MWWSEAAKQGYAEAQYNLATCMMNGSGTEKNEDSAVAMFRAAADQEHPDAMCMVASFFADGKRSIDDDRPLVSSSRMVGCQTVDGAGAFGIQKNLDKAVALYEKAAAAGSEEAEYKLMVIEDLKTREVNVQPVSSW